MLELTITDQPAKVTGERVSQLIAGHTGDVLCLLSGGSALDVIEYIDDLGAATDNTEQSADAKSNKSECRTIFMMVDERVSGESEINNFLQLQSRYRSRASVLNNTIDTTAAPNETPRSFAERIEKTFFEKITTLTNPKIICILGVGPDGHTAGIFPLDKKSFHAIYQDDQTYVPVQVEGLTIDSRASFTPSWILSNADHLIGYVVGTGKKAVLSELISTNKKLHERPAEILKLHKNAEIFTDQDVT